MCEWTKEEMSSTCKQGTDLSLRSHENVINGMEMIKPIRAD